MGAGDVGSNRLLLKSVLDGFVIRRGGKGPFDISIKKLVFISAFSFQFVLPISNVFEIAFVIQFCYFSKI